MAKVVLIGLYEPEYLGARFLAGYLLERNHEIHIINLKASTGVFHSSLKDNLAGYQTVGNGFPTRYRQDIDPITEIEFKLLQDILIEHKPDIIGIGSRSINDDLIPALISTIKEVSGDALIVAGGFGPTLRPEFYLENGIDLILRGEGEEALTELADMVDLTRKNNDYTKEFMATQFSQILNASYLVEGKMLENRMRPQEANLDLYSFPLYGDEYCTYIANDTLKAYHDAAKAKKTYQTLLGRGCIGSCTYCSGGQWYKQYEKDNKKVVKRRNRSLESIKKELRSIDKSEYKYVTFFDEMFTAPYEFMMDFFTFYKEEINLPFFMYLSYEQCLKHEDMFQRIVDAGWNSTGIGIQTGSERLAREYGRKNKNESYIKYAQNLFNNNIVGEMQIIGGNCYETEEDFEATLNLIKQLPFDLTAPTLNYLAYFQLKLFPKAPILEKSPRVLTHPMPSKLWLYRASLCFLRRICDDETFAEIRTHKFYQEEPELLAHLYRGMLAKMQGEFFRDFSEKYEGKEVIFYGFGEIYQYNKYMFKNCNPIAILCDQEYMRDACKEIDNIPIMLTEEVHQFDKEIPIICFSNRPHIFLRRLMKLGVKKERIYTSTTLLSWHKDKYSSSIPY